MEKNYYDILGISVDATETEIKSAFRKLARKLHPDVAGNSPEIIAKFKEINEAYEVLSDKEKRKKYDILRGILHKAKETREEKNREEKNPEPSKKSETDSKQTKFTQKEQKEDKNREKEKNTFQDAWDNFIKNTKQEKNNQKKYSAKKIDGTDITSDINITVSEAVTGTTRTINILHTEPCPKCHGRRFANGSTCSHCNGKGEIAVHKKISVKIPEHVKQNAKIRISGEGNQGVNGGKNGDLYLIVKIETEAGFQYEGLNILQTVPVQPFEAVLGSTVDIKTPNGNVSMKLMSGTMNGQKYRLAKQGLQKDGKYGDMIITISIEIPKNLSKEEVLLYEKLKQVSSKNVRENIYG